MLHRFTSLNCKRQKKRNTSLNRKLNNNNNNNNNDEASTLYEPKLQAIKKHYETPLKNIFYRVSAHHETVKEKY